MTLRTLAIIGAGLAGARTAETLRSEGFDGRIVIVGDEPIAPYERPALSKEFLAGKRDERSLLLRPEGFWDAQGIELVLGDRVTRLDPAEGRLRTRSGRELGFDTVVLATGARPHTLPLPKPAGVHQLRTLGDARRLRDELVPGTELVVIGGGFVGAEVASTAASLGVHVTIVEAATAPVGRVLGSRVGLMLADRWRMFGVEVRLGVAVASMRTDGAGRVDLVRLTDGSELRADAAVVGIGVQPQRELLSAQRSGIVVLAGDVGGPGHWTAAAQDGVSAARTILRLPGLLPQPPYVWSDQFGLHLQLIGAPGPADELELDGDRDSFAVRYRAPGGSLSAALLANRPRDLSAIRRELDTAVALAA